MQLPEELLCSLAGIPGFDEQRFVNVHEVQVPVTSIRLNPKKLLPQNHFPGTEHVPWCPHGRYLPARPSFTLDPVFHGGAYYVQEASSMFLHHVLSFLYDGNNKPQHVLDLCGAPGGKSTLLAAALPDSLIVANEVIKSRVGVLAENISKWGSDNVVVTSNDPKDFTRLTGFFDLIVTDAPCSGSGLFRKDKEAIKEWSEANVQMCSLRQQRILNDVLPSLKTGGHLVYSTCSYSSQENEDICDWLVENFNLTPVQVPCNESWGVIEAVSQNHTYGYRFYPYKLKGEGFFIACFRQDNPVDEHYAPASKLQLISKAEHDVVNSWLRDPASITLFHQKENIVAIPVKWAEAFAVVQRSLHVRKSGVAIGSIKGKDLVPHHELALTNIVSDRLSHVSLNKEDALRYLKRNDLVLNDINKGWTLVRHEGINLGWAKVLPTRVNNYYPPNWRILIP